MAKKRIEADVKKDVKKWLGARGIWYYMPVQNGMGVTGVPDFICCWAGRFVAIETKAPGKRGNLSENQKHQIEGICATGGTAFVVDDVSQLDEEFSGAKVIPC